jgi:hypothetical protein
LKRLTVIAATNAINHASSRVSHDGQKFIVGSVKKKDIERAEKKEGFGFV